MENKDKEQGRQRKIQVKFRLDEDEFAFLLQKKEACNFKSMSDYLRNCALYGKVEIVDLSEIKKMNKELSAIGKNVNQIAARVNSTDRIYSEDIDELREQVQRIWQLQQSILSGLR